MSVSVGGSGIPIQENEKWDVETICEQNGFVNGTILQRIQAAREAKSPFECPFARWNCGETQEVEVVGAVLLLGSSTSAVAIVLTLQ